MWTLLTYTNFMKKVTPVDSIKSQYCINKANDEKNTINTR